MPSESRSTAVTSTATASPAVVDDDAADAGAVRPAHRPLHDLEHRDPRAAQASLRPGRSRLTNILTFRRRGRGDRSGGRLPTSESGWQGPLRTSTVRAW